MLKAAIKILERIKKQTGAQDASIALDDDFITIRATWMDGFSFARNYSILEIDTCRLNATDLFTLEAMKARGAANETGQNSAP